MGAVEDFSKAIEQNPQYVKALTNRGASKYKLKDYKGAIEDLNKAIRLDPRYGYAIYNRAFVINALSDKDAACKDWRKAKSLGVTESEYMIGEGCR